ncbi:MAG: helix-turn-helix transcriptional regulator [Opitutae bacterium]|nr:helix-turn-helix transcriptional regulator [Opitutae bacterium]
MTQPARTPPPAAAVQSHPVQDGLTLYWGDAAAVATRARSAVGRRQAALFLYRPGEAPGGSGAMQAGSVAALADATGGGFAVGVLVWGRALTDLAADERTPGLLPVHEAIARRAATLPQPLTPAVRLAIESIRRCPFFGPVRQWALAARAHDLLVEFLAQAPGALPSSRALPPGVDARLAEAARLLETDLANPPTLAALARQAGLSETSLKRGFRRQFGQTVFGRLRARRMLRARALLESGDCTVLEAATRVGYSNPSNFAAAFRREFGLNPKQFQLAARR